MGYSLEVLLLGLLSTCLLWKGVHCDLSLYTLDAPLSVTVPEGLCVIIPCRFTYDPSHASNDSQLYGYWYEVGKNTKYDSAIATNNATKEIESYARSRFNLSEEVARGNCSLIIEDAQTTDERKYFFRMEKEPAAKFSYSYKRQTFVNVTNLEDPEIKFWGNLRAGHPVNITCTAPGSCSLNPPHLAWKEMASKVTLRTPEMQTSGSQVYISEFDFIPSAADHGRNLTCSVSYGTGTSSVYKEKTVHLNVSYPPQTLRISVEVLHANKSLRNETDGSQIAVDKGDSVVLHCTAEGNPSPNMTWAKTSRNLQAGNELKLSNVRMQDTGEYKCQAQNSEGSEVKIFHLSLQYCPRPCKQKSSHCWRDGSGFQCNCSICSSPVPTIQWQVNGETLEGNTTERNKQVTTWIEEDVGTSTLSLIGNWDGDHRIVCVGTNPKGEFPMMFFLFSSAQRQNDWSTIIAVVGVLSAVIVLIIAIILISRKYQRKYMTDLETHKKLKIPHSKISPSGQDSNGIGLNQEEDNDIPKELKKAEESTDIVSNDPEDLHYASVTFITQKPMSEVISEVPQTEYAEIKR